LERESGSGVERSVGLEGAKKTRPHAGNPVEPGEAPEWPPRGPVGRDPLRQGDSDARKSCDFRDAGAIKVDTFAGCERPRKCRDTVSMGCGRGSSERSAAQDLDRAGGVTRPEERQPDAVAGHRQRQQDEKRTWGHAAG
jgi:hypothetical protein